MEKQRQQTGTKETKETRETKETMIVKTLFKGTMLALGTERVTWKRLVQMRVFPHGDTMPEWVAQIDWSDSNCIFEVLNGLKNDIDYASMSLEIDGSRSTTGYKWKQVCYKQKPECDGESKSKESKGSEECCQVDKTHPFAEFLKLSRLRILWDDDFIRNLEIWEYCVTFCAKHDLFPPREFSGYIEDHNISSLRMYFRKDRFDQDEGLAEYFDRDAGMWCDTECSPSMVPKEDPLYTRDMLERTVAWCSVCDTNTQTALQLYEAANCDGDVYVPMSTVAMGRCEDCKVIAYCSTACQAIDWPRHKVQCKMFCKLRPGCGNDDCLVTCVDCGSRSTKMSRCGRCEKVSYCSKIAQITDWKRHRKECWKKKTSS